MAAERLGRQRRHPGGAPGVPQKGLVKGDDGGHRRSSVHPHDGVAAPRHGPEGLLDGGRRERHAVELVEELPGKDARALVALGLLVLPHGGEAEAGHPVGDGVSVLSPPVVALVAPPSPAVGGVDKGVGEIQEASSVAGVNQQHQGLDGVAPLGRSEAVEGATKGRLPQRRPVLPDEGLHLPPPTDAVHGNVEEATAPLPRRRLDGLAEGDLELRGGEVPVDVAPAAAEPLVHKVDVVVGRGEPLLTGQRLVAIAKEPHSPTEHGPLGGEDPLWWRGEGLGPEATPQPHRFAPAPPGGGAGSRPRVESGAPSGDEGGDESGDEPHF